MRLGVNYIVFDDLELVEDSIDNIREHVDFITLGYSHYSWTGTPTDLDVEKFCKHLVKIGKADDVHYGGDGHRVQADKFQKGLDRVRELTDCTHFLLMPNDEFFVPEQFVWAKNEIEEGGYDAGWCLQEQYWMNESLRLMQDYGTGKPVFFDIRNPDRNFVARCKGWPRSDPSTRMPVNKLRKFTKDELVFHHMSYVRKDIGRKWNIRGNFNTNSGNVARIQKRMDIWKPGMKAVTTGFEFKDEVDLEILDPPIIKLKHFYEFDRNEWLLDGPPSVDYVKPRQQGYPNVSRLKRKNKSKRRRR